MHPNIVIDPEFQALLDPLEPVERAQLEANIVADGCRDPLVLWGDLLIDGHNRHEICTRLGLPFGTVGMDFADRDAAMDWMDANQMGKRNMSPEAFTRALGRRYNRAKKAVGAPVGNSNNSESQLAQIDPIDSPQKSTADRLAADHGVSPATVKRAGAYDAAAKVIEAAGGSVAGSKQQDVVQAAKVIAQVPDVADEVPLAAQFAALPAETQQAAMAAIATASEPAKEVMREAVKAHVANNSGNNEWYTPSKYVELAREVMGGIDTDPATSEVANRTVQAAQIYTADDDGRTKVWAGRVWMNPPYAQPLMGDFAEAVASKFESGEIEQACILVNNATETQWFQRMLVSATAVCFPKSRIKFIDPDGKPSGAPLQGQAILYMGSSVEAFKQAFSAEGRVLSNV